LPTTVKILWDGQAGPEPRAFWYEAFVPDLIARTDPSFTSASVEAMSAAVRALAELDGSSAHAGLEALSPARAASSFIEGLTLSHRRLSRATFDPASADRIARYVAGNISAMERAIGLGSSGERLEVAHILELHRLLFARTPDEAIGGRWRDAQGWIGRNPYSPWRAEFIPPPPDLVAELMADLCEFAGRTDLPAIAQAGIMHAQFETIHPFPDGNGRVGRALIHIILRRRGAVTTYVPPVSLVLAANADTYVDGLTDYRDGQMDEWCRMFGTALRDSTALARDLGGRLQRLAEQWRERAGRPRRTSAAQRLIERLPSRPVLDHKTAAELLDVSYPQARAAVLRLQEAGILRPIRLGRQRNQAWEAPELLDLLDAFEFEATTPTRSNHRRRASPRPRPTRPASGQR
jgi:Fic family protein